ncbi:hypothetical protein GVY41_05850 [Frigidibacter albus]|uniref:Haem-binding uptake Tiki superfamily ChaN domain-containing protein n=1 Tax=Frigidibacter albus TaxID=1465486 RepID=A0A6L8VG31_9RHOB|nr:ChaN family lipoprotein [Frigidibacter albus]MZQ88661.1 hypothetical protein [Frigidibacter albus]NBE30530.1 hypothetical protein [Frigidibacter albus]GGH49703.1 hypothetical protein GCM10011341_12220 [Frigidibacter albus]
MRHVLILTLCVCAVPAFAEQIGPDALADLRADVVILGEVHDNPVHHAHQAQAVTALAPAALVFEMLTPEQAAAVTDANRGDAAALGAALDWEASGWPDFTMYHPIFTAAPEAKIYGAALPRDEVRRSVTEGAAVILGADAERFGLTSPLPAAEQAAREADQMAAHCNAMPAEMMPGMVEAQRLRDASLARAAVQATAETGGPVAVIAGSGHARRDWGIPAALALAAPELSVLSVGQIEAEGDVEPGQPFDVWLVTEPTPREDPCAAFN